MRQVGDNVADANSKAQVASKTAETSRVIASEAAEAMTRISTASEEIARVVTVINEIAFQINLLALNAGGEAARAGEAGRGFSGVASEVRHLAQRASEAAKEIDEVIGARSTQWGLLIVFGFAAVTAVPALVWLFILVNQDRWHRPDDPALTQ